MTDAFVIETQGYTAGIAVRDGRNLRFFASESLFWNLDNRRFRNLRSRASAGATVRRGTRFDGEQPDDSYA
jgi:hypothetical protein